MKKQRRANRRNYFIRENNLLHLLSRVLVKQSFPRLCPVMYFHEAIIQVRHRGTGVFNNWE